MLRSTVLFKISASLLVLFAMGHTYGFLSLKDKPPESISVSNAMQTVYFQTMGFERSYWDFYVGFGLFVTVYLILTAIWCWQFSKLCLTHRKIVSDLVWPLIICQLAVTILCCTNFFWGPIVFSSMITILIGLATYKLSDLKIHL